MLTCKQLSDALAISDTSKDKLVKIRVIGENNTAHEYEAASCENGVITAAHPTTHHGS